MDSPPNNRYPTGPCCGMARRSGQTGALQDPALGPLGIASGAALPRRSSSAHTRLGRPWRSWRWTRSRRAWGASTRTSGVHESIQRTSSMPGTARSRTSTFPSRRCRICWVGCQTRSVMAVETAFGKVRRSGACGPGHTSCRGGRRAAGVRSRSPVRRRRIGDTARRRSGIPPPLGRGSTRCRARSARAPRAARRNGH